MVQTAYDFQLIKKWSLAEMQLLDEIKNDLFRQTE